MGKRMLQEPEGVRFKPLLKPDEGGSSPKRSEGSSSSVSSFTYRWITVVILLAVAVVYQISFEEEKNEAEEEILGFQDVEKKEQQQLRSKINTSVPMGGDEGKGNNPAASSDGQPEHLTTVGPTTANPTPSPIGTVGPTTANPTPNPTAQPHIVTPRPKFDNETRWIPEPNPFVSKFNTTEWIDFLKEQWKDRATNAIQINEKYGSYCPSEPNEPMCPILDLDGENPYLSANNIRALEQGPTVKCIDTGNKKTRCGFDHPWLNKTIWPLVRGPFCANQDKERKAKFPLPEELNPYMELGYDRADPTNSKDMDAFDGGSANDNNSLLSFDPIKVKEHFIKFEAMLEHYYEGLSRSYLERQLAPEVDSPLYGPMLQAYADQIARVLLRAKDGGEDEAKKKMVIGVLGDSVTSGTDNCYYDAWPESLRRQLAPLFGAMGLEIEIRNAAKNGGYSLPPQMLCAYDMLGVSDRPDGLGLDFLFQCNEFVRHSPVDLEHLVRKAILGDSHTVVSISSAAVSATEAANYHQLENNLLEKYAAAGLTIGKPFQDAPPELGLPEKGHKYWFPDQSRAFWGMQGDGFCHVTTRAGSSAVVNRNWHWGPKMHQTYADAYALLLSRATRMAIDELSAGRMPPDPPKPSEINPITPKETDSDDPPTWREFLRSDVGSEEAVGKGIAGVRCAVGQANQAGSTLLKHWLRRAEGSPFEEKMNARKGLSFVPPLNDTLASDRFYFFADPISTPNGAVEVGDWVAEPKAFGEEAPRTPEQCRHVDGSTLMSMRDMPEGVSWLVWEVPKGAVSTGRTVICHDTKAVKEDMFDEGNVRFHYAVPNGNGWKVSEDVHKSKPMKFVGQDCMPVVAEMNEADRKAAREGGMWVAVEWKQESAFRIDYLVSM